MSAILHRLQRGLEEMYRVDTALSINDFVVDENTRARMRPVRRAREQLLLVQAEDALELALFVEPRALANLAENDPASGLDDGNLGDFLLALEGVSHFVYVAHRARADRALTVLELELQAEVDKYVTCLLLCDRRSDRSQSLRQRLFEQFTYEPDLSENERARYQAANANAHRYSASLERRFVDRCRIADMLDELRRFYRMSLRGKLDFIAQAA